MTQIETITCETLRNNPDKHSPVSGLRCRGCGANAWRFDAAFIWYLADGAAWCPTCAAEDYGVKPAEK